MGTPHLLCLAQDVLEQRVPTAGAGIELRHGHLVGLIHGRIAAELSALDDAEYDGVLLRGRASEHAETCDGNNVLRAQDRGLNGTAEQRVCNAKRGAASTHDGVLQGRAGTRADDVLRRRPDAVHCRAVSSDEKRSVLGLAATQDLTSGVGTVWRACRMRLCRILSRPSCELRSTDSFTSGGTAAAMLLTS